MPGSGAASLYVPKTVTTVILKPSVWRVVTVDWSGWPSASTIVAVHAPIFSFVLPPIPFPK